MFGPFDDGLEWMLHDAPMEGFVGGPEWLKVAEAQKTFEDTVLTAIVREIHELVPEVGEVRFFHEHQDHDDPSTLVIRGSNVPDDVLNTISDKYWGQLQAFWWFPKKDTISVTIDDNGNMVIDR